MVLSTQSYNKNVTRTLFLLPTSTENFVKIYQRYVFIANGIAESHLCVEIASLRIKYIKIGEGTCTILEVGEFHIF